MTDDPLKLISAIKPQIQKVQRTPCRVKARKALSTHIIFKLQNIRDKEKGLKETRDKKYFAYKRTKISPLSFSPEDMQTRRK
jgi:hypothetical protein